MKFKAVIDRIEGRFAVLVPDRAAVGSQAVAPSDAVVSGQPVPPGPDSESRDTTPRHVECQDAGPRHTTGRDTGPCQEGPASTVGFDIPIELLPAGAGEGDVVIFDVKIDREETRKRLERVQGMIDRLVKKTRRREADDEGRLHAAHKSFRHPRGVRNTRNLWRSFHGYVELFLRMVEGLHSRICIRRAGCTDGAR
ncbi:MAG TPA: DUF3006 domain-containing protein [Firmicutes bacterium]|nr:DUF3006 domain-containing protein [Bacillota bacterium]